MATVKLATNGNAGSVVQGQFGTYQQASDGTVTVDSRDAPPLIAAGMTYMHNAGGYYTTPVAPRASSSGRIHTSGAFSSGAVAISNQPDVMRQVQVVIGAGTTAITAGAVTVTYLGQDFQNHTDVLSGIMAANAIVTQNLSRGVVSIATMTVGAVTGGASPFIIMSDTNLIAVPSDPNGQDFVLNAEYDTNSLQSAPGTFSTSSLGCTTVVAAPNGTQTYSFGYVYVGADV